MTIQITGTNGQSVTLSTTDDFTSCKYGTGYGDKLGALSQTTGVIPFSVTFTPSGNYGNVTIEGKLTNSPALKDSVSITIKGQSEESARQLEGERYTKVNDKIEFFGIAMGIITGLLASVAGALLVSVFSVSLILALIGIAVVVAAITVATYSTMRREKAANDRMHKSNLAIIELLPEVDPSGGTENNTDAP